jgi:hypothetical protein
MRRDEDKKPAGRRDFLRVASLGAVSGTVAAIAGGAHRESQAAEADQRAKGYRETLHVKKVYELARF